MLFLKKQCYSSIVDIIYDRQHNKNEFKWALSNFTIDTLPKSHLFATCTCKDKSFEQASCAFQAPFLIQYRVVLIIRIKQLMSWISPMPESAKLLIKQTIYMAYSLMALKVGRYCGFRLSNHSITYFRKLNYIAFNSISKTSITKENSLAKAITQPFTHNKVHLGIRFHDSKKFALKSIEKRKILENEGSMVFNYTEMPNKRIAHNEEAFSPINNKIL